VRGREEDGRRANGSWGRRLGSERRRSLTGTRPISLQL
jgi:hypothetical protein